LLRAADVVLKERRKMVLVARETPLNPIHLTNMTTLANLGVVILPPMLTFYNHPQTIRDMTQHIVGKVLDVFGLEAKCFKRWGGPGICPQDDGALATSKNL
jgi:polyprenyl P-hydroxybenzoate/phenylacrylic acid decarboxylase-like protein